MRPSMEQIWMDLACRLGSRSTCAQRHVGCVVVSEDLERVYSVGYNGGAKRQENHCVWVDGRCGHIHAEDNALIKCYTYDPRKVMFVSTMPCEMCCKKIVNSGFSSVYYMEDNSEVEPARVLKEANIKVERIVLL